MPHIVSPPNTTPPHTFVAILVLIYILMYKARGLGTGSRVRAGACGCNVRCRAAYCRCTRDGLPAPVRILPCFFESTWTGSSIHTEHALQVVAGCQSVGVDYVCNGSIICRDGKKRASHLLAQCDLCCATQSAATCAFFASTTGTLITNVHHAGCSAGVGSCSKV